MAEQKNTSDVGKQPMTKEDTKNFRDEIVHEFHVVSEGLIDQIKLLAEGHSGIIERLNRLDVTLARMEKESEHQHMETRALVKISFSELDRRVSDLESQVKDLQEWKKQVQSRLQS